MIRLGFAVVALGLVAAVTGCAGAAHERGSRTPWGQEPLTDRAATPGLTTPQVASTEATGCYCLHGKKFCQSEVGSVESGLCW